MVKIKLKQNWVVEKTQQHHIPTIAAIAAEYDYEQLKSTGNIENGFLVSNYSEDTYRDFVSHADHFYVVLEEEAVVGFILAFSRDLIPGNDWVGSKMKQLEEYPFILIKQAAVTRSCVGKGVATLLFNYLIDHNPAIPLIGAIVLTPPNQRSIHFHEKLGFKKIWRVTPPDGIVRGVWRWDLAEI
jgi:GNAT superfamily N-acetyltransferase